MRPDRSFKRSVVRSRGMSQVALVALRCVASDPNGFATPGHLAGRTSLQPSRVTRACRRVHCDRCFPGASTPKRWRRILRACCQRPRVG